MRYGIAEGLELTFATPIRGCCCTTRGALWSHVSRRRVNVPRSGTAAHFQLNHRYVPSCPVRSRNDRRATRRQFLRFDRRAAHVVRMDEVDVGHRRQVRSSQPSTSPGGDDPLEPSVRAAMQQQINGQSRRIIDSSGLVHSRVRAVPSLPTPRPRFRHSSRSHERRASRPSRSDAARHPCGNSRRERVRQRRPPVLERPRQASLQRDQERPQYIKSLDGTMRRSMSATGATAPLVELYPDAPAGPSTATS